MQFNSVLIFKECPLAIEAAEGLLSLGVKGTEVNAMMLEMVGINGLEWLVFIINIWNYITYCMYIYFLGSVAG